MAARLSSTRCFGVVKVCRRHFGASSTPPLSPAVWHLVENNKIDPSSIKGTGKGGRLLKGDVLKALADKSAQPRKGTSKTLSTASPSLASPSPSGLPPLRRSRSHKDIPLTEARRETAQKFAVSKTSVPHSYARITCCTDGIHAALQALQGKSKVELSVNDFVIVAAARALREVPEVNSVCPKGEPKQLDTVNICLAVQSEGGLTTPVITNADRLGLAQIAEKVAALKKEGSSQEGSFTIYNLDQFDLTSFTAVINPPQAAILAVGSSKLKSEKGESEKEYFNATLSLDARVGDDLLAAKWLAAFQREVENFMPIRK